MILSRASQTLLKFCPLGQRHDLLYVCASFWSFRGCLVLNGSFQLKHCFLHRIDSSRICVRNQTGAYELYVA